MSFGHLGSLGAGFGRMGAGDSGGGGSAPSEPSIEFTDSSVDPVDRTVYTFEDQAFGAASADRKILVGISERAMDVRTIESVTVGGVAATSVVQVVSNIVNRTALYIADVPTGTTGDIVVTLSAGAVRCGIGVWAIRGIDDPTVQTATSVVDPATSSEFDVSAGSVAVGYCLSIDTTTPRTSTWTGLAEDFDESIEANSLHSGASAEFADGDPALTIICDLSGTPSNGDGAVFAVFGPPVSGAPTLQFNDAANSQLLAVLADF